MYILLWDVAVSSLKSKSFPGALSRTKQYCVGSVEQLQDRLSAWYSLAHNIHLGSGLENPWTNGFFVVLAQNLLADPYVSFD